MKFYFVKFKNIIAFGIKCEYAYFFPPLVYILVSKVPTLLIFILELTMHTRTRCIQERIQPVNPEAFIFSSAFIFFSASI